MATYIYSSFLGNIYLDIEDDYIKALDFEGAKYFSDHIKKEDARPLQDSLEGSVERLAFDWLEAYFSKENPSLDNLPLKPVGSLYQKRIWKEILEIPYGQTLTYGELAQAYNKKYIKKTSARAVGGAVGTNPIAIMIPCHRVMGADGSLTGYAGGLDRKVGLLRTEDIIKGDGLYC